MRDRITARAWRAYADLRRRARRDGDVRDALAVFPRADRRDVDAWNRATAAGVGAYRAAFAPAATRAAVVCVSRRPHLLSAIVANVARQVDVELDVVLVTNDAGFDATDLERELAGLAGWRVIEMPPSASLGACLNLGVDAVSERFVAKFDDDDWYGPHHVADSLRAHRYAGAGVVGKHSYYAEMTHTGDRVLRFPANEFRYSGTLAGGTLVVDRERIGGVRFPDLSLGEDRGLLHACHRRGVSTFAADRFNFVQRRGGDNTWTIADEHFLERTLRADPDDPIHAVDP